MEIGRVALDYQKKVWLRTPLQLASKEYPKSGFL
jgi:hypothetical protein